MRSVSTILRGVVLTGALALAAPAVALASGSGEHTALHLSASSATQHSSSVGGGSILRTIIALVIVIGLIYGIARVLKMVKGGGKPKPAGDGLQHLATLPLAQNRSVALVRSGSDVVLVGISESGVTPIKVYTEAEAQMHGIIAPADAEPATAPGTAAPAAAWTPGNGLLDVLRRMTVRV
ncbi:MAG TPA: flagellar biosynthetic protein FliO [Solirubrobacteraceae bacterium]|nr:flagellar biosynthetic protein FliO [Solirubrobacteraceae bacterium]